MAADWSVALGGWVLGHGREGQRLIRAGLDPACAGSCPACSWKELTSVGHVPPASHTQVTPVICTGPEEQGVLGADLAREETQAQREGATGSQPHSQSPRRRVQAWPLSLYWCPLPLSKN